MAHEKIYCDTADPTWHASHPTDEVQVRDCHPGMLIQWDDLGAVGVGTGDLTLEYGKDVPALDLADFLPEPADSDTAAVYERLAEAIAQTVQSAYDLGVSTVRVVWMSRENLNHAIRTLRRGRNTAYGADE